MPGYVDSELTFNNYRIYYKPYSLWTSQCSLDYTTNDIGDMGQIVGKVSKWYKRIFIVTLILYPLKFVFIFFGIFCCKED